MPDRCYEFKMRLYRRKVGACRQSVPVQNAGENVWTQVVRSNKGVEKSTQSEASGFMFCVGYCWDNHVRGDGMVGAWRGGGKYTYV
jgi:hypothetical protein